MNRDPQMSWFCAGSLKNHVVFAQENGRQLPIEDAIQQRGASGQWLPFSVGHYVAPFGAHREFYVIHLFYVYGKYAIGHRC